MLSPILLVQVYQHRAGIHLKLPVECLFNLATPVWRKNHKVCHARVLLVLALPEAVSPSLCGVHG